MPTKTTLATPDEPERGPRKSRRTRANNEGSIFPYKNGWAGYVWVTTPEGKKTRKWAYGKTREETHEKWLKLHELARRGPVVTKSPKLSDYLTYWLANVVEPNLAPKTAANYEMFARLYITPALGSKRLDKLTVRDVQTWVNKIRRSCQCCDQRKDAARPEIHSNPKRRQHCCAVGKCCKSEPSEWTVHDAYMTLRAALSNAVREEALTRNVAANVKMSVPRKRKVKPWSVDEARTFLESARTREDPMYPAYVLVLVLGLRLGEVLGLRWEDVDLDQAEMTIGWQLQRVAGKLLHRQTKTDASDATLPFPEIVTTALRTRQRVRDAARDAAGDDWQETGLVFTTASGRPIEPSNFRRSFANACAKANVRRVHVHATRKTCASLLVALDVHPRVAMQILRHSQISVTMNVYSEVSSAETRRALKKLGDHLDS
ncbi:site-specific tyrosine recombinase XerC [Nonomuraea coxensis DSM 45129]|uniref:Site-specific tyrosine recombinase XerC n=1 Tax=Nonomuraea coxensis DSM 45129 TaxID=1122611 RepID=A0ABX8TSG4_9ACTN|nr:site-specific integrase [Nonomuraea coxensis]QYC37722.1 site-specific tyrosine recombinase XerC [Nonomuraea coxensis DSM 45129]